MSFNAHSAALHKSFVRAPGGICSPCVGCCTPCGSIGSPCSFGSPCSPCSVPDICSSPCSPDSPCSVPDICESPCSPCSPESFPSVCSPWGVGYRQQMQTQLFRAYNQERMKFSQYGNKL